MATSSLTHPRRHPGGPHNTARALAALGIAILGGAVALALALLVGAVHTSTVTTTVLETAPASVAPTSPTATWAGVYAQAAAGQVDITVQTRTTIATPFGEQQQQATALGSGFVLDGRGDLVTAAHVVDGASSISVAFENGAIRSATILGKDDASDIAVLHVSPAGLTLHPLRLGTSATLAIGDSLAVLGDPLGFDRSLSTGVVSALDRTIQAPNGFEITHSIQTDAAMNPGNSGGPLLNQRGQVIGIADQIATGTNRFGGPSSSTTSTGVGFAVPIGLIKAELTPLEHGQTVSHAYLGISTGQTANYSPGALIAAVQSGTPAASAGLRSGEVIIAWGGETIASASALIDALADARPREQVTLTILRGHTRTSVTVKLGAQPSQAPSR